MFLATSRFRSESVAKCNDGSPFDANTVGEFARFIEKGHQFQVDYFPCQWMDIDDATSPNGR